MLLHCLGGFRIPRNGSASFDAQDLSAMPEAQRSALRLSWIGIVLQFGGLLRELTVVKNTAEQVVQLPNISFFGNFVTPGVVVARHQ